VAIQCACSMAEAEPGGDGGEAGLPPSSAYVIEGGVPLRGTVHISGAKNAVLKLMAAAVLCDEPCTISNAPRIADVETILEVLARGQTIIRHAAAEPEVDNLIELLNAMGACVRRDEHDRHTIVVQGVPRESLHGASVEVIPDRIEAGSFAVAAAVTGGELLLEGARADHLGAFLDALRQTGIDVGGAAGCVPVGG